MEKLKKMPKRQWTEDHLNVVGLKPNPFKSSNDRNSVGSTNKLVTE